MLEPTVVMKEMKQERLLPPLHWHSLHLPSVRTFSLYIQEDVRSPEIGSGVVQYVGGVVVGGRANAPAVGRCARASAFALEIKRWLLKISPSS